MAIVTILHSTSAPLTRSLNPSLHRCGHPSPSRHQGPRGCRNSAIDTAPHPQAEGDSWALGLVVGELNTLGFYFLFVCHILRRSCVNLITLVGVTFAVANAVSNALSGRK